MSEDIPATADGMPETPRAPRRRNRPPGSQKPSRLTVLAQVGMIVCIFGVLVAIPTLLLVDNRPLTPRLGVVIICTVVFAFVLGLWALDASQILPFQSPWLRRGIWAAAIASILASGAAVYKEFAAGNSIPYSGTWSYSVTHTYTRAETRPSGGFAWSRTRSEGQMVMGWSYAQQVYKGMSRARFYGEDNKPELIGDYWEITSFSPQTGLLTAVYHRSGAPPIEYRLKVIEMSEDGYIKAGSLGEWPGAQPMTGPEGLKFDGQAEMELKRIQ
jgi:hypothetical protein